MKKLVVLTAFGAGYVLGTRAGRERYEQIRRTTKRVTDDPRVQEKAHQAADLAKQKAPVVAEKVTAAAGTVADKVKSTGGSHVGDDLNPESTHFQDDPFPKGDLP